MEECVYVSLCTVYAVGGMINSSLLVLVKLSSHWAPISPAVTFPMMKMLRQLPVGLGKLLH